MLLTETKLNSSANLSINNYKIYRADHPSGRRKGGSAILVKRCIGHDELPSIVESKYQIAQINLHTENNSIRIAAFYSAPENQVTQNDFLVMLRELSGRFLMGGDFNCKHPRWGSNIVNPRGRVLHDTVIRHSLEVIEPQEPTFYSFDGHMPDILDFFLGKQVEQLIKSKWVQHEMSSDHYPFTLELEIDYPAVTENHGLIKYPFDWAKYKEATGQLANLNLRLKTRQEIDKGVSELTNMIRVAAGIASSANPLTRPQPRYHFSANILALLNAKKVARRRWEQTRFPSDKTTYNRANTELKKALKEERDKSYRTQIESLNARDGSLWKKTKAITKEKVNIPPLHTPNGWCTTAQDKANLFEGILVEQFSPYPATDHEFDELLDTKVSEPHPLSLPTIFVSPGQVRNAINRSRGKKAPGHDEITQPLLKGLHRKGVVMLTHIYNAVIRTTYFPSRWKHAHVVMVKKPNKRSDDPESYRPISLLPLFSKILERLLLPHLMSALAHLLPDTQFGFRQNHSCSHQLHRVVNTVLEAYEKKKVCLGVFLDSEKAFDKVLHKGLLVKIKPHVSDTLFRILKSYLDGRTFAVKCEKSLSASRRIVSSVPQGSVWGPFLYLIYMHDIPLSDGIVSAQFADDTAVLKLARNFDEAGATMQRHLDDIQDWSRKWRLRLNPDKSSMVPFSCLRDPLTTPLQINNSAIPIESSVRYLGLQLDSKLLWNAHISNLVKKIRQRIHQLKALLSRNSPLSMDTKRLLFLSLIRPIWTYACGLWGSAAACHIRRIQVTQNRVLRMIANAPWYVRNSVLHSDMDIPYVTDVISANRMGA
ncbi:Hypothetical protein NTJ_05371 [Nesidiocoris tenuis]|uniref:Reverse transcriptase domain-containing protein n=1 Tax=Nesidiocoris tenuis TaxID=355587 RepID=A0ABN7AJY1_9HEMI|nr:Hypothetical protein NTJ_05371 [Nesidiocoris tenuis]